MTGILNVLIASKTVIPLSASVDPLYVSGENIGRHGTAQTSERISVSPIGGTPPYTYVWSYVSGDVSVYPESIILPSVFFYRFFNTFSSVNSVWKCTVTDSAAATVNTVNVTITLSGGT